MTAIQQGLPSRPPVVVQYFKGTIDGADFTATVYSITRTAGKWTIAGSKLYPNGVKHQLQISLPDHYSKGVYKLEDHPDIRLTYTTDDLNNPVLIYGASGLIDFTALDPAVATHAAGALQNILTRDDGNPVSVIHALFSLG